MTSRRTRVLIVFAWLLAVAPASAQGSPGACSISAGTPRRVELPDGRIVSVDVQSIVRSNGSIYAIGRHAYVFPRITTPVTSPIMRDSIIGFEIEPGGAISLVPAPPLSRPVFFPKVAAGPGGFHAVFATSGDSAGMQVGKQDTATIWYARYADRQWTVPERVTSVRRAYLQHELTSELLERNGTVSWSFTFADSWDFVPSGGIALLQRRRGGWTVDTLATPTVPGLVRLVHATTGDSLLAVFTRNDQRGTGPTIRAQLYLTRFMSTWAEPRLIAGDGTRELTLPILATSGDDIVVSWDNWIPWQPQSSRIEWLRIGRDGRLVNGPVIAAGEKTYPFEFIVMSEGHPFWLYHGDPLGSTVEVSSATDVAVIPLGDIGVPFRNPRARTFALDRNRALMLTQAPGAAPNDPMAASWMTTLEFRCPRSARR
jgi:hypothetical protein